MSGYSVGDNDSISGTFGTEIEIADTGLTAVQNDLIISPESSTVTVTNLAAGETAFLHFERDAVDPTDTYTQDVGVATIIIRYVRDAGQ